MMAPMQDRCGHGRVRQRNGEPFDLQGIEISTFDEEGRYTGVTVYYPYDDAEVKRRFAEGN